jgi:hypothetical protein
MTFEKSWSLSLNDSTTTFKVAEVPALVQKVFLWSHVDGFPPVAESGADFLDHEMLSFVALQYLHGVQNKINWVMGISTQLSHADFTFLCCFSNQCGKTFH